MSEFRHAQPPAFNSPQMAVELAEIKNFTRTFDTDQIALHHETQDATFTYWYGFGGRTILEEKLDRNPPRRGPYLRPHGRRRIRLDCGLLGRQVRLLGNPPESTGPRDYDSVSHAQPSELPYPAAHACDSAAIASVLGHLFPREAQLMQAKAEESGFSRLWAGIHFRSDIEAGLEIGRKVKVGQLAIERAKNDGSSQAEDLK